MKVILKGGPFDGADVVAPYWVEAVALRDSTGKLHRYVYIGEPMEVDGSHRCELDHESDRTHERLVDEHDLEAGMVRPADLKLAYVTQGGVNRSLREVF